MDDLIYTTIKNLENNNMLGYFVKDKNELLSLIAELIPKGSSVGCGDSVTLEQMRVYEFLRNGNYDFYDKYKPDISSADKRNIYLKNFSSNTFISGTNAVTLDGKLFNIDGNGSRIAPIIYGPEQVIIIVGKNKIVKNLDLAVKRARQIAAPLDAKRLKKDVPCTKIGRCLDCKHKHRICNDFVLITGQFISDRIKVIIVDETLGY